MAAVAYRYYRVVVTADNQEGGGVSRALTEFSLYENAAGTGVNLAIGSTATANKWYSTNTPARAIDNKLTTDWLVEDSDGVDWIQLRLPVAKVVRSFKLISAGSSSGIQTFRDFTFEVSEDGLEWEILFDEKGNTNENYFQVVSNSVSGISKLSTGFRSSAVFVHDWDSGKLLGKVTPKTNGSWSLGTGIVPLVLVTHIGPSGYEPKSDGPITPQSW